MNPNILSETTVDLWWVKEKHPTDISIESVRRWCRSGVCGMNGRRVILESVKVGGTRVTSIEAYRRFVQRQNSTSIQSEAETKTHTH